MKKAFIVVYKGVGGNYLCLLRTQMQLLGSTIDLIIQEHEYVAVFIPTSANTDSFQLKRALYEKCNPFTDSLSIMRMDAADCIDSEQLKFKDAISDCATIENREIRNFNRFNSYREAIVAYKQERPMWVYADGLGAAMRVEFDDWCWLPVKQDGVYDSSEYRKYVD